MNHVAGGLFDILRDVASSLKGHIAGAKMDFRTLVLLDMLGHDVNPRYSVVTSQLSDFLAVSGLPEMGGKVMAMGGLGMDTSKQAFELTSELPCSRQKRMS